jgi:uncharacterized membrane protein YgaE (UPF0421/DUF939 family)
MKEWRGIVFGPRVLKTGIAVTLALYHMYNFSAGTCRLYRVEAIFLRFNHLFIVLKQFRDEILTNKIGAAIALFSIYYLGEHTIMIGLVMIHGYQAKQ